MKRKIEGKSVKRKIIRTQDIREQNMRTIGTGAYRKARASGRHNGNCLGLNGGDTS